MTYNPKIIIYEADGTTAHDTVYTSGIVTDALHAAFTLSAMGGCLGGELHLPEALPDTWGIPARYIVKMWWDASGDPIYSGRVIERDVEISDDICIARYLLRGLWDDLEAGDLSGISTETLLGADENASYGTAATVAEYLHTNYLSGTGIAWAAGKVSAATAVDSLAITPGTDLKRTLQQLAYMASTTSSRVVVGVDGAGEIYLKPVSTDTGDRQISLTIGGNVAAATEKPATAAVNQIKMIGGAIVKSGDAEGRPARRLHRDSTSITANGRQRVRMVRMLGTYQEADFSRFSTGFFARHATPARKLIGADRIMEGSDDPPIPWLGRARYIDSERSVDEDIYFESAEITLGEAPDVRLSIGAPDIDDVGGADLFAPNALESLADARARGAIDQEIAEHDASDTVDGGGEYRYTTDDEIAGAGGGGGGESSLTRGGVYGIETAPAIYDSANTQGYPVSTVLKIYVGDTGLTDGDVVIFYRRLNSSQSEIATPTQKSAAKIRTEGEFEYWTDNISPSSPYTTQSGDFQLQVGARVETAAGPPAVYQYYAGEGTSSEPDWDQIPKIPVIDISGDTILFTQQIQSVGWVVS